MIRPFLSLVALAALLVAPALATAQPADKPVTPTIVETGRLKYLSSSGDIGGSVRHPDGSARIWNFNPDTRTLLFFDPGTGQRIFSAAVPSDINPADSGEPMLVGGGKLLLFPTRAQVVAFDGTTGEYLWTFKNNEAARPFRIAPVNAVPDVVLLARTRFDQRMNRTHDLELLALDARTGAQRWQIKDKDAVGEPVVWRSYVTHTTPDAKKNNELTTHVRNVTTGESVFECDFVPVELRDSTVFTARWRSGMVRTRTLLPDASGKLVDVKWVFPPELQVPENVRFHIPAVDAPIACAIWAGSTNPNFSKRAFLCREEGTTVHLTALAIPEDVDLGQAWLVRDRLLAVMFRDADLQWIAAGVDLRANRLAFALRPDEVRTVPPEPDQWPMFGTRFSITALGDFIGYRTDVREQRLSTLRVINPFTGSISAPKVLIDGTPPFQLSSGEFGWLENDEVVVCTAGKTGKLTSEPAEGDQIPMARVVGLAQRWLVGKQNRDGSFSGPQCIPVFSSLESLGLPEGADLYTTAIAGIALCRRATDEFDEFGLLRRGALRRAVRWVCSKQNAEGRFVNGDYSNFLDHLVALEFLVAALPANPADTTDAHRKAIARALPYTINKRLPNGAFAIEYKAPASFRIPQAPPDWNGPRIVTELNRADQQSGGFPITMGQAHRVFKAAMAHPFLRNMPGLQAEIDKNIGWVKNVAFANQQMMAQPENLAQILGDFGDDLGAQFAPNQRVADMVLDELPRPVATGHRGRVQGVWWYCLRALPSLVERIAGSRVATLQSSIKGWLYSSRFPDGSHAGPPGAIKATAIAALTAVELDK